MYMVHYQQLSMFNCVALIQTFSEIWFIKTQEFVLNT